jgi:hypothetical protein
MHSIASLSRGPVLVVLLVAAGLADAQEGKFTLKEATAPPPAELKPAIREQLDSKVMQVFNPGGQLLCEIWFAKSVPAKATPEQVKNGLTYRELRETAIIGAIRFPMDVQDYRKQDVKSGVYTLRLAMQPQDGDHMGTAPHPEFCLLISAALDEKPDLMEPKKLHDLSARTLEGSHPGILLLFPHNKPEPAPKLVDQGMGHWVLRHSLKVNVNGQTIVIGIGLTVAGHSSAA